MSYEFKNFIQSDVFLYALSSACDVADYRWGGRRTEEDCSGRTILPDRLLVL